MRPSETHNAEAAEETSPCESQIGIHTACSGPIPRDRRTVDGRARGVARARDATGAAREAEASPVTRSGRW